MQERPIQKDLSYFYNELIAALYNATSSDDLKNIQSLFDQYALAAEIQGISLLPLIPLYVNLLFIMENGNTENINHYHDVMLPIAKFQARHEEQTGNNLEQANKLAMRLDTNEFLHLKQHLLTTAPQNASSDMLDIRHLFKNTPASSFFISGMKNTLDYIYQMHLFEFISSDIMTHILVKLNSRDITSLTLTCYRYHAYGLFQNTLSERTLLNFSLTADPVAAEKYLMQLKIQKPNDWWRCILKKVSGTEPCGRKWNSVSPIEFLAWIGDTFFRKMLLSHIPPEGYSCALQQLKGVRKSGLEGRDRYAPVFDYLNAGKYYFENYNMIISRLEGPEWIKVFGGLQSHLSSYCLQWLCDPIPFLPTDSLILNRAPERLLSVNDKLFLNSLGISGLIFKSRHDAGGMWMLYSNAIYGQSAEGFFGGSFALGTANIADIAALEIEIASLQQSISLNDRGQNNHINFLKKV